MALHLYNTLTKTKEEFKPITPGKVLIYSCGPTVYSHPHIGNFRSFICADLLRRYLEYKGFQVTQIMNITDVGHMTTDDDISSGDAGEDKVQAAARKEKKTPLEITRFYADEFQQLSKLLNIKPADKYPLATEHIPEMINMVKTLLDKGYAYQVNGNVYFDISKFPAYGKLSGNPLDQLIAGARVEVNSEKKSPLDFALWKQDPKHLMQWDSPWGRGFPGWHIECSAMSLKYLGQRFDIHTGGEDNIFPHHECEIAQSEGALGHKVINYWFHIKHLLVNNQKMSKSLGNFYTVRDILAKGFSSLTLRYALLNTHYHQPLNFTLENLEAAKNALQRLADFRIMLNEKSADTSAKTAPTESHQKLLASVRAEFEAAMDDDLNISEALARIFDFIREANKTTLTSGFAASAVQLLKEFDSVLGVLAEPAAAVPPEIEALVREREDARKRRDFKRSDEIRQQLIRGWGIIVEDKVEGQRIKFVRGLGFYTTKRGYKYDLIYYHDIKTVEAIPFPHSGAIALGAISKIISGNQVPRQVIEEELEKGGF
ncbi:MAG: cysteine--tRNA ligase [Candidatus Brocadiia bacterium]